MKTFLLPRISSRQQTKLEEAGVEFHHWENNSILITGKRAANKALKALGAEIVQEEEDFAHFVRLVLRFEEEEPEEAFVVRAPPRQFGGLTRTPVAPVVPVPEQPDQPETQVEPEPKVETQPVAVDMERRARSRRNYIQACRERLEQIREAAKERVVPMKATVRDAELAFFNATRANFLATSNINAEELTAKLTQEQEAVRNLDKVEMVRPQATAFWCSPRSLSPLPLIEGSRTASASSSSGSQSWVRTQACPGSTPVVASMRLRRA